jgi:Mn2+/Fe2+ NRAMP family transporter
VLFAILRLVNNREVMGAHVNGTLYNIAAWLTHHRHVLIAGFYNNSVIKD